MRRAVFAALALLVAVVLIKTTASSSKTTSALSKTTAASSKTTAAPSKTSPAEPAPVQLRTITDTVRSGETFYDIFLRHGLDVAELLALSAATGEVYNLNKVKKGRTYSLELDRENRLMTLTYKIDDDNILNVMRTDSGFEAERKAIEYETVLVHMSGTISENLVSAMQNELLALELSDIFAWDIDFTTDLRKGDAFRLVVEEKRLDGKPVKFGNILSAEFINNGSPYYAYRFEQDGRADYYDQDGKSLRRAFLKAPLSYRRISSGYTYRRFHPVHKRYRPHLGVDYAAPTGTPVSTVGDGTVVRAGYYGSNGNQVVVKHHGGFVTYYGHLHKIKRGIRRGVKVRQGQVIGYVGNTGVSTGPHLDYRIKKNGRFVNPLKLRMPRGKSIRENLMAGFEAFRDQMNTRLSGIRLPVTASADKPGKQG